MLQFFGLRLSVSDFLLHQSVRSCEDTTLQELCGPRDGLRRTVTDCDSDQDLSDGSDQLNEADINRIFADLWVFIRPAC